MPSFITGQELENILMTTRNAASYNDNKNYIEILDGNDKVIRTYQVNKETGQLS